MVALNGDVTPAERELSRAADGGRDESEARLVSSGIVRLTQAARRNAESGVIVELASLLNGWAALIDRYGEPVEAVGAARVHIDDAISAAMHRTRKILDPNLQAYPIGNPDDPRGHLVVSARSGETSRTRDLAAQAAALLDLTFFPRRDGHLDELARHDFIDVLLTAPAPLASRLAARWKITSTTLVVIVLRSRSRSLMLETKALEWFEELELPPIVGVHGSEVVAIAAPEAIPFIAARLERAAISDRIPVRGGIGRASKFGALNSSYQEARQAADIAVADGKPCISFGTMPTIELLLRTLTPTAVSALTDPLRALPTDADGGEGPLLDSLRVFLAENGSWEAAASQLGVHRHTLRHRIERVEQLTGLSMGSAEDRVRAWLAIRALAEYPRAP